MAANSTHFTWRQHPCPPWCEADHHDDDHAEDRIHRSAAQQFPAVVGRPGHEVAEDLIVVAEQRCDGALTLSIQVAEGPLRLDLTREGAALMRDALDSILVAVTVSPPPAASSRDRDPYPPSSATGSP